MPRPTVEFPKNKMASAVVSDPELILLKGLAEEKNTTLSRFLRKIIMDHLEANDLTPAELQTTK
jgi:hypothetical protein